MSEKINTIVFPIIRQDLILPALESLEEFTPPGSYSTIVVNQTTPNREFEEALYESCDVVIRPHFNYGFAQASNFGLRLASSRYAMVANDDIIFTNDAWWPGVIETFERFEKAAAVNPQSQKEPGWGWNEPGYRYRIPQPFLQGELKALHGADRRAMQKYKELRQSWDDARKAQQSAEIIADLHRQMESAKEQFEVLQGKLEEEVYKLSFNPDCIKGLVEEANWAVVDAFACWGTVFKAEALADIGLFDERFRDGGGEDYDFMSRGYGKGYRCLSTSRSWAWHWWGRSKDSPDGHSTALPSIAPPWNKLSTKGFGKDGLYDPDCDVWHRTGVRTDPNIYRAAL